MHQSVNYVKDPLLPHTTNQVLYILVGVLYAKNVKQKLSL
jgi:hypothetical protein